MSTSRQVLDDLARLVATGFWGENVEQAAEEMIRQRLQQVLEQERRLEHAMVARDRKSRK